MTGREDLVAALHQAETTADRHRRHVERLHRYLDECPADDPRRESTRRTLDHVLRQLADAERAADAAADRLDEARP